MGWKIRLWRVLDGPIVKQFRVKRSREQLYKKVRKYLLSRKVEDRPSICELFVLDGNCKRRCPILLNEDDPRRMLQRGFPRPWGFWLLT